MSDLDVTWSRLWNKWTTTFQVRHGWNSKAVWLPRNDLEILAITFKENISNQFVMVDLFDRGWNSKISSKRNLRKKIGNNVKAQEIEVDDRRHSKNCKERPEPIIRKAKNVLYCILNLRVRLIIVTYARYSKKEIHRQRKERDHCWCTVGNWKN